ncbi:MAG: adenosylcobinamide-GDP ribazoletransferase [Niabella sp.]
MKKIRQEFIYFLTAVMFFTRIPIPIRLPWNEAIMNQSQKYYSWTGLIVGAVYTATFLLGHYLFGETIAVILAICSGVLLTGAFHEDGFTDVCDAFGGGYGKERILTIMKDSRIGAYGTIGICLLLLLKFSTLLQITITQSLSFICFALITGNTASRFIAATTIYTHKYVRHDDTSKAKPVADKALPFHALIIGFTAVLVPFLFFGQWKYMLALPVAYLAKVWMAAYFKKQIGGYTGDCLGAIQQVSELVFYLSCIAIWKFI